MTKPQTDLDLARLDAQNLHKKISANIAKSQDATWADIKSSQADAKVLIGKMIIVADAQGDVAKANIKTAIGKLDDAANLGEDHAIAGKEAIERANASLRDGAQKAAQSLSQAVADFRTKLAKAIEPQKVLV